ncbi:type II secretion system secretin GspD [Burkholderiaceae bacterium DAT-1]|nr:type II secretion system secretin GspD [Burkholderiaceae bacterium DAT-1]
MKTINKLLLTLLLSCSVTFAADDASKVTLNFVDTPLESVAKAISLITGKNFVLDQRAKGNLNVISSSPVDKKDAYPIFLAALRQLNFTVVEMPNGVAKIIPEDQAKTHYSPTYKRKDKVAASGDRIITQIYPLKHESAVQMLAILRPLVTVNNQIAAYTGSNSLVITDYADNVKRISDIIGTIDQPSDAEIVSIPLHHAAAADVAQTIARLMPEVTTPAVQSQSVIGQEGVRRSSIIPDVRANTLLVRSEAPSHLRQIKNVVGDLDRPGAATGSIHIVYLKNANASRLVGVLKGVLTGQDSGSQGTGSTQGNTPQTMQQQPNQLANQSGTGGSALQGMNAISRSDLNATNSTGGQIMPGVWVSADVATNSLLINAPDSMYHPIKEVIDKLDMRRAQVFVEAMVAEVSVSKSGQFGVQWMIGAGNDKVTAIGGSSLGGAVSGGTDIQTTAYNLQQVAQGKTPSGTILPSGGTIGIINGALKGGKVANLGILATAIESNGGGTVLSMPNLVTVDNEAASILVGQNVPFVTGSQQQSSTTAVPFQTINREDIGISLEVKPQISDGGAITLDVKQKVQAIDTKSSQLTGGTGLVTNKRSLDTRVIVDDGDIVVLGGLLSNNSSNSISKIPLLGDIPILGNLFRYEGRQNDRTNLMIFLRPVVIRDGESAKALAQGRYLLLKDTQDTNAPQSRALLPDLPQPGLPLFDLRQSKEAAASGAPKP